MTAAANVAGAASGSATTSLQCKLPVLLLLPVQLLLLQAACHVEATPVAELLLLKVNISAPWHQRHLVVLAGPQGEKEKSGTPVSCRACLNHTNY